MIRKLASSWWNVPPNIELKDRKRASRKRSTTSGQITKLALFFVACAILTRTTSAWCPNPMQYGGPYVPEGFSASTIGSPIYYQVGEGPVTFTIPRYDQYGSCEYY